MDLEYAPRRHRRAAVLTISAVVVAAAVAAASAWISGHGVRKYESNVPGEVLVSADGRTVSLAASWTACENPPTLKVAESADGVALSLRREDRSASGTVCDNATARQLSASLAAPIGSR